MASPKHLSVLLFSWKYLVHRVAGPTSWILSTEVWYWVEHVFPAIWTSAGSPNLLYNWIFKWNDRGGHSRSDPLTDANTRLISFCHVTSTHWETLVLKQKFPTGYAKEKAEMVQNRQRQKRPTATERVSFLLQAAFLTTLLPLYKPRFSVNVIKVGNT